MIVYSNGEREKFAEAPPKAINASPATPSSSVMAVPTNTPSKVAEKKPKESPKPQPKKEEVAKEQPTTALGQQVMKKTHLIIVLHFLI
ncbi:MAG: hypothetical protein U5N85_09985 [Arcicella sp.]|nr:hypothetical protein [Arcicella sp.]